MKKRTTLIIITVCIIVALAGCGKSSENKENNSKDNTHEVKCELSDGLYLADFETDSSMFHVNDTKEGKGILKVENGVMTIHIVLTSKNITNLYPGLAEDAQREGAVLLEPTSEEVTYGDGITEEVNSFDVPVPYLDETFDLALIGKKNIWYDHKVSVSNPVKYNNVDDTKALTLEDGEYDVNVTLIGGSGKATIESAALIVSNGEITARIVWSSPNYDYMLVDGNKYLNINEGGNSTFEIPVLCFDENMPVIADTVAMSTPHEIEYNLIFDSGSIIK